MVKCLLCGKSFCLRYRSSLKNERKLPRLRFGAGCNDAVCKSMRRGNGFLSDPGLGLGFACLWMESGRLLQL
jgi:hypothetical protein